MGRHAIAGSDDVVVSSLTQLEAEVMLRSGYLGGRYPARQWGAYREKLAQLLALAPFRFSSLGGGVFETAITQDHQAGKTYCRLLDRLHLAAIAELGLRRLMTHDAGQAGAAAALRYRIDRPGRR